jgi:hypothetical protein
MELRLSLVGVRDFDAYRMLVLVEVGVNLAASICVVTAMSWTIVR